MPGSTTNRAYPFPLSTDNVDIPGDVNALAAAVDTDVAGLFASYMTPVEDLSIGSIASGFTLVTALARTLQNGHDIFVYVNVTNNSTITPSSGVLTDVNMFTVDSAYRPTETIFGAVGSVVPCQVILNTSGQVLIADASDPIASGNQIGACFRFIKT